jgi:hypothetical protein
MKALGKYFTYNELTHTNFGLLNVPNQTQTDNLILLVKNILDPLRELYGKPIKVNSGFRSELVNKFVKGANNSQHLTGQAVDIDSIDNAKLFSIIRMTFDYDQLIWEAGNDKQPDWVHVSYAGKNNRFEVLKMKNGKYTKM